MTRRTIRIRFFVAMGILAIVSVGAARSQEVDVQGRIAFRQGKAQKPLTHGNAVLWLTPEPTVTRASMEPLTTPGHFRMEQKNKSFNPHLLVVPLGSTVDFPNLDPFFHNVFSQFNGKRFDLGLYEAGSTRVVHFDHEGVSYIFCNIHSQMAGVVVTLRTPYFAVATRSGQVQIAKVPAGDYQMHLWAEGADPKELEDLSRRVHIGPSQHDLGAVQVYVNGSLADHKNKFGEDYRPEPDQPY
jgi:plastocyanin